MNSFSATITPVPAVGHEYSITVDGKSCGTWSVPGTSWDAMDAVLAHLREFHR